MSLVPDPRADSDPEDDLEEECDNIENNLNITSFQDEPLEVFDIEDFISDVGIDVNDCNDCFDLSVPDNLVDQVNEKPIQKCDSPVHCSDKSNNSQNSETATQTPTKLPSAKPTARCKKSVEKQMYRWSDEEFWYSVDIHEDEFIAPKKLQLPIEYFKYFFSEELIQLIVDNTNLYSVQKSGKSVNVNNNDILDFLAIEILMGVVNMPAYTDYWSESLRYDKIANIMPLKRYQAIRRNIHFVNNVTMNDDRYFKIRPVLEHIRQKCLGIPHEKRNSVDEMMIPYKGTKAGSRRQYIKNKPKKWGYKMFVRAGISGIVYDFILYGGEDTFRGYQFPEEEMNLGLGAKVVISLCKNVAPCSAVYFDNFFTSLELVSHLREKYGILSLGTIRANRLRGCKLKSDKDLSKSGRGSFQQVVDNSKKLVVVKWQDNRAVTLTSSFVDSLPLSKLKRYSKDEKRKVDVTCPHIVSNYNMHMGGVDLSDMLVALYRTTFKTHKWYLSIFSQIIDICINNSWLIYRREVKLLQGAEKCKYMKLKEFRLRIFDELLLHNRPKRGRPSAEEMVEQKKKVKIRSPRTELPIRLDNIGHFPVYTSRGRCRNCQNGKSSIICQKCDARLCLTDKRNCFVQYHSQ